MKVSFKDLASLLATSRGGFTLWLGAGASIALTRGATPGWGRLVDEIATEHGVTPPPPTASFPDQLELLAQQVGHGSFRKGLRRKLIQSIAADNVDEEIVAQQAVIACRAGAVVSFNIETITAMPTVLLKGASTFFWKTFRERTRLAMIPELETGVGPVAPPVYFPHGLLYEGSVVMTKSEYDRHLGSLAVTTAVHLSIGGDLVILGMSLGDSYLRQALLQNRRWIRNVYWLGATFEHLEWTRVAEVTPVTVAHGDLWKGLSDAILDAESSGALRKRYDNCRNGALTEMKKLIAWHDDFPGFLDSEAKKVAANANASPEQVTAFAQYCIDMGFDVPAVISADSRCKI